MRLQKYLASCGVASRRSAEKLIAEGHVSIDGQTITEMGVQVEEGQTVRVDGVIVRPEEEKHYILYHKPAGEVTTVSDPEGRTTVLDKFRDYPARLYPVGRLDYDSEGLLLLTNDGALTERMLHPSMEIEKVYLARVSNQVTPEEARRLEAGVLVDGRKTSHAKVKLLSVQPLFTDMLITIHEGRNRQVRKMVEQVGHQVVMLRRVRFGPLKLGDLPRGMWRPLTPEETDALRRLYKRLQYLIIQRRGFHGEKEGHSGLHSGRHPGGRLLQRFFLRRGRYPGGCGGRSDRQRFLLVFLRRPG